MTDNKQIRILVADDATNMRRTIRNMLKVMGYANVAEAADGVAAFHRMQTEKIDLVITDWNMPKLSGLELLKKIRQEPEMAGVPVLMVTAELGDDYVAVAAEKSIDGYMVKPFELATLQKKIGEVLQRRSTPSFIDQQIAIGRAMADAKQYDRALGEFRKILEKHPASARALEACADVYARKGDVKNAEAHYRMANDANPLYLKALQGLSRLLEEGGDAAGALAALEKANVISPNDPERQAKTGKLYLKAGNMEKAKAAFQQALKRAEGDVQIITGIGESFLEAGLDDLAAGAFRQSLMVNPSDLHAYNRLGIALRRKGAYLEAIEEYKKALAVAPNDEALYFNMAKAYQEARHFDEALKMVKRALQLDPEFKEALALRKEIEAGGVR